MKYANVVLIGLLCSALMVAPVGCSVSQAKVNTVVTDIANWTPVIASDASALLTDIASFEPADAATIQAAVTIINTDSTALTALCKQYLAAPGASVLAQIASLVGTLATADSGALLSVLQIKNPASQNIAKGVLTTIATAVTILSGYLQSVNVQPSATVAQALEQLKPYVNRSVMGQELARAQLQGIVPANLTLAQIGY